MTRVSYDDIQSRKNQLAARRSKLSSEEQAALSTRLQGPAVREAIITNIPRRPQNDAPIPLSFAQERLWIWERLNPGSIAYNVPQAVQAHGTLNVSALKQALDEVIRRHESLRTNFVECDGSPRQLVRPFLARELPMVDLSELESSEFEITVEGLAFEEARRPYDLAKDELLRVTLLKHKQNHIVLRTTHHIICDEWSGEVFIREISAIYDACRLGIPSVLPEPPLQMSDYAVWQRKQLEQGSLETQFNYWKGKLDGLEMLDLPVDRPRSPKRTRRAACHDLMLSAKLSEALRAIAHQVNITVFVLLLGALKILLFRYSGQEDIAVGTVMAARDGVETERLIGFFLNTIVLRSKLSKYQTIRELIHHVADVVINAQAHQDLPFEKLIEEIRPERVSSSTPLFSVLFLISSTSMDSASDARSAIGDLRFAPLRGAHHGALTEAKFDLTVSITTIDERIGVRFEYDADLFNSTTVQRMKQHYETLLELLVANLDQRLETIDCSSEAERQALLIEWNQSDSSPPSHWCLQDLFELRVNKTPDAVAVEDDGQQLTYRELNRRANQLADYLYKRQLTVETCVGVYMERSATLLVAMMAILKAGAVYVPMDVSQPSQRLSKIIEDSRTPIVLTLKHLADRLGIGRPAFEHVDILRVDEEWTEIEKCSSANRASRTCSENAAYVIYTSGSTGNPKGVVASHLATVNRLAWMWKQHPFRSDDIVCQKTMIGFVDSIFEILGPILAGVRLTVVSDEQVKNPQQLIQELSKREATHIVLVPSLLRMLIESDVEFAKRIPALRFWVASGEYLSTDLAGESLRQLSDRTLLNSYGASELAADVMYFDLHEWVDDSGSVPLGVPICNTRIYLLDHNDLPTLIGVRGELHVAGMALARGYLHRPDLTAERFIPDALGAASGQRLYKTGDIARNLPRGSIEYVGRRDFQVKVRGFRIELGEIEATLSEYPSVEQAIVVPQRTSASDKRLAAYIVSRSGKTVPGDELASHLRQRLPEYMIPVDYFLVSRFPLTSSGKVDRVAVSRMCSENPDKHGRSGPGELVNRIYDLSLSLRQHSLVRPRNLTELQLVDIWERVLGTAPIGVTDNFFKLGGTSLSAVRLVSLIEKRFGYRVTLNELMQRGNIGSLAELLNDGQRFADHSVLVPFRRGGSRTPLFFVHAIGGEVLGYYQLCQRLADDQPFYALQSPLGWKPVELTSIESIAAEYLHAVQEVQPEGPYHLAGFSWGGVVAFEMAQQLHRNNHRIGFLGLVDSPPPSDIPTVSRREENDSEFLARILQGLAPRDIDDVEASMFRLRRSANLYRAAWSQLQAWGVVDSELDEEAGDAYLRNYLRGYRARLEAHNNYRAATFAGKVTLFQADPQISRASDWSRLSTMPLDIREIPGPHWTILREPQVEVLACELSNCLSQLSPSVLITATA